MKGPSSSRLRPSVISVHANVTRLSSSAPLRNNNAIAPMVGVNTIQLNSCELSFIVSVHLSPGDEKATAAAPAPPL